MAYSNTAEQWALYGVGIVIFILRIIARVKVVGFKGFCVDDYLVPFAMIFYTVQLVSHQIIHDKGLIIAMKPDTYYHDFTDAQRRAAQIGGKANIVSWISYASLIWTLKGCMVFLYYRLTAGLPQRLFVHITGGVILTTYVAMILMILLNCRPLNKNWTSPYGTEYCVNNIPHFAVLGPLNVLTDIMLLCIPLPLIIRAKLPLRRKLIVGVLLGGGFFLIIAVILNNVFSMMWKYDALYNSFQGNFVKFGTENPSFVLSWGTRETFVAVLVVNAPCIKPLISSSVWLRVRNRTLTKISSSKHSIHSLRNRSAVAPQNADPELEEIDIGRGADSISILSEYQRDTSINSKRAFLSPSSTNDDRLSVSFSPAYENNRRV
ncbi:hypothetical protein H072_9331 [Dactylellina haptotyla CBS 200.50]|uniref:Rhodopsin domain-containing protein n=1 Tax=Dactylellina haptotyla (strain CBS 200.50) TaxID=1284197 RepID=S8BD07_DACHA|nr:hypothetical protein H072_9331 [Dactylellina haptotyla CBS 200.50]